MTGRRVLTCLACLAVLLPVATLGAQAESATRAGKRTLLPRDREIALARSAAPPEVSAQATVYVLTDTGYAVADPGANGNACLVNRSWPASVEPQCFDAEGVASVMAMDLYRMSRVQRGAAGPEVDREIAEKLMAGHFRLPRRPAMSYMMSSAQHLIGDDGKPAGQWRPHLMLFIPYITSADLGLGVVPNSAAAIVVDSGKPLANIMVIVPKFMDPVPAAAARP